MALAWRARRRHRSSVRYASSWADRKRILLKRWPARLRRKAKLSASSGRKKITASAASAPFLVAPTTGDTDSGRSRPSSGCWSGGRSWRSTRTASAEDPRGVEARGRSDRRHVTRAAVADRRGLAVAAAAGRRRRARADGRGGRVVAGMQAAAAERAPWRARAAAAATPSRARRPRDRRDRRCARRGGATIAALAGCARRSRTPASAWSSRRAAWARRRRSSRDPGRAGRSGVDRGRAPRRIESVSGLRGAIARLRARRAPRSSTARWSARSSTGGADGSSPSPARRTPLGSPPAPTAACAIAPTRRRAGAAWHRPPSDRSRRRGRDLGDRAARRGDAAIARPAASTPGSSSSRPRCGSTAPT